MRNKSGFLSDTYVWCMVGIAAVVNALLWYYVRQSVGAGDAFVTLHFTASLGVDLIGEARELYDLPYAAAWFSLANVVLARLVFSYDILSAYFLVSALPLFNLFMFLNGYLLVSVSA